MKDLFGNEVSIVEARRILAKRKEPTPSGYAARPGTGPKGETCGTCAHLARIEMAKTYFKCELNRAKWTHGRKTDVLKRALACAKFEKGTQ